MHIDDVNEMERKIARLGSVNVDSTAPSCYFLSCTYPREMRRPDLGLGEIYRPPVPNELACKLLGADIAHRRRVSAPAQHT